MVDDSQPTSPSSQRWELHEKALCRHYCGVVVFGLLVRLGVAQVGSLFSADAWNNIGFTGEQK